MRPALRSIIAFAVQLVVTGSRTGAEWEALSSCTSGPIPSASGEDGAPACAPVGAQSVARGADVRGVVAAMNGGAATATSAVAAGGTDQPFHGGENDLHGDNEVHRV